MANKIQLKRGLETGRSAVTPAEGELLYTTDDKTLFIGDGTTAGGKEVSTAIYNITDNSNANWLTVDVNEDATFAGNVEVANSSPSFILKDSNSTGNTARGWIEWQQSDSGIRGKVGLLTSIHSEFGIESRGGPIVLSPDITGSEKSVSVEGTLTVDGTISLDEGATGSPQLILEQNGVTKANLQYFNGGNTRLDADNGIILAPGNTNALEITTVGNATFAGDVIIDAVNPIFTLTDDDGTTVTDSYIAMQFREGTTNGVIGQLGFLSAATNKFYLDSDGDIQLRTNGATPALTLDSSQNATFSGDVIIDDGVNNLAALKIYNDNTHQLQLGVGSTTSYITAANSSAVAGSQLKLRTDDTGGTAVTALTIDSSQTSTFAGDVKAQGKFLAGSTGNFSSTYNSSFYNGATGVSGTTYYQRTMYVHAAPDSSAWTDTVTNPGANVTGITIGALVREDISLVEDLDNHYGLSVQIGNYSEAGSSVVNAARGINISNYNQSGTINNFHALYIGGPSTGGTYTNTPYGIYQAGTLLENYFGGKTAFASDIEVRGFGGDNTYLGGNAVNLSSLGFGLDASATRVIEYNRSTAVWSFGKGTVKDVIATEFLNFNSSGDATFAGTITATGGNSTKASLNIPHGTTKTSPVNGDMWTTTAGLHVQVNGNTERLTGETGEYIPTLTLGSGSYTLGTSYGELLWQKNGRTCTVSGRLGFSAWTGTGSVSISLPTGMNVGSGTDAAEEGIHNITVINYTNTVGATGEHWAIQATNGSTVKLIRLADTGVILSTIGADLSTASSIYVNFTYFTT